MILYDLLKIYRYRNLVDKQVFQEEMEVLLNRWLYVTVCANLAEIYQYLVV